MYEVRASQLAQACFEAGIRELPFLIACVCVSLFGSPSLP